MSSPTMPFGRGVPPPEGTTSTRVTTWVPIGTMRLGWRSRTIEYSHLSRRANLRIFFAHREKANCVSETFCHPTGPTLKLFPRPFEAMVFVAELPRRQSVELDVVLRVRGRHDDRLGAGCLE